MSICVWVSSAKNTMMWWVILECIQICIAAWIRYTAQCSYNKCDYYLQRLSFWNFVDKTRCLNFVVSYYFEDYFCWFGDVHDHCVSLIDIARVLAHDMCPSVSVDGNVDRQITAEIWLSSSHVLHPNYYNYDRSLSSSSMTSSTTSSLVCFLILW